MRNRPRTDLARRGYGQKDRAPNLPGQSQILSYRTDANWSRSPCVEQERKDNLPFLASGWLLESDGCAREGCLGENELRFCRLLQESPGFADRAGLQT